MPQRWNILALLFVVRATMAFQYQSVAAVAPLLEPEFGLADIGVLIGLYFAPGVALAVPGGTIGRRFGDKATVLAGLVLMLVGGTVMALASGWSGQVAGRLLAGTGGVLLNVLMSKMVADWFAQRELSTAMAVFVNSWPVGIAVSLVVLPVVGTTAGVAAVHLGVTGLVGAALVAFAILYPPAPAAAAASQPQRLAGRVVAPVIVASMIWTLYNIGVAMMFSFGPSMLVERGWSVTAAGSTTSIVLWLAAVSVPLGGILADRTQRHDLVLAAGCVMAALMLLVAAHTQDVVFAVVGFGLIGGLPAGSIMSLPAQVLAPPVRAVGMGVFYAVFYAGMMLGPAFGGVVAKAGGTAAAAFDVGALALLACPILLWLFRRAHGAARAGA